MRHLARSSAASAGEIVAVALLLDHALRREPGGANNPEGAGGHTGKQVVNFDNVNVDKPLQSKRPMGNSAAAGIRRLEKAADKGRQARPCAFDQTAKEDPIVV